MLARACPKPSQSSSPFWEQACTGQEGMPGKALRRLLIVPAQGQKDDMMGPLVHMRGIVQSKQYCQRCGQKRNCTTVLVLQTLPLFI